MTHVSGLAPIIESTEREGGLDVETGKINRKRQSFTMVANKAMRDKNLSLKAKGLYALMQSYLDMESIGFVVYKSYLQNNCCTDGRDSFNSAWKELEKAGYLITEKKRTEKGTYVYEYTVVDNPSVHNDESDPHTGKPSLDKPQVENPKTVNPIMGKPEAESPHAENPSVNKESAIENLKNNTENTKHMYLSGVTPEEFLISRQNGIPLSGHDKKIIKSLSNYGFSREIQIALLDYVLSVSQNRLVQSFVDMVAGEWTRDGVTTLQDVEKEKEKQITNSTNQSKHQKVLPDYMVHPERYQDDSTPISPEKAKAVREQLMREMREAAAATDSQDERW